MKRPRSPARTAETLAVGQSSLRDSFTSPDEHPAINRRATIDGPAGACNVSTLIARQRIMSDVWDVGRDRSQSWMELVIRFQTHRRNPKSTPIDQGSAYLFGSDGVPLRAEIEVKDSGLICQKRATGPAGLALLWPMETMGTLLMETVRVQERAADFNLPLELARAQMMRVQHKCEDWGLFDCQEAKSLNDDMAQARELLIEAIKQDDPQAAAQTAERALISGVDIAERMASFHAQLLLKRRLETAGMGRRVFGCTVPGGPPQDSLAALLSGTFDFVTVPMPWNQIEPKEQQFRWKAIDLWVDFLRRIRVPAKGSPLVCFQQDCVPDWLYIWEHDFETVRELTTEHIRRVVGRYGQHIQVWDVISGIHANQSFSFNFEQLIELTRVAAAVTKQVAPRSLTILDLVAPWGEYYARNQRSIPPLLYAEMAVQSGIQFDALGLQFCLGTQTEGMYARDMFQISALLDRFGTFGKPIHITAVEVPSNKTSDAGTWRGSWSDDVQARWLRAFCTIALSKPLVETICWKSLVDPARKGAAGCGLLRADFTPKPAFEALKAFRDEVIPHAAR